MEEYLYEQFGYTQKVQLFVNLVGTQGTGLGHFAQGGKQRWLDPFYEADALRLGVENLLAQKENIQIGYNLSVAEFRRNPKLSEEVATNLSFRLQRSYNYQADDRHYIVGTTEFPWHMYDELS